MQYIFFLDLVSIKKSMCDHLLKFLSKSYSVFFAVFLRLSRKSKDIFLWITLYYIHHTIYHNLYEDIHNILWTLSICRWMPKMSEGRVADLIIVVKGSYHCGVMIQWMCGSFCGARDNSYWLYKMQKIRKSLLINI